MKKAIITRVSADDWQGVYRDEELIDQGHSFHPYSTLKQLIGYTILDYREWELDYDWMNEEGHLPSHIEDIPEEKVTHRVSHRSSYPQ